MILGIQVIVDSFNVYAVHVSSVFSSCGQLCCAHIVSMSLIYADFVFFFQAEDGIRDWSVTGVQTCALPIFAPRMTGLPRPVSSPVSDRPSEKPMLTPAPSAVARPAMNAYRVLWVASAIEKIGRSEERRVGKECRSGWSRRHEKKKKYRRREG